MQAIATQFGMELPVAAAPGAPGAAPSAPGMPDSTAAAPVPAAPAMQPQQAAAPRPAAGRPADAGSGRHRQSSLRQRRAVVQRPQLQAGPQVLLGFHGHVRQAQARFQRVVLARRVQLPAWELPAAALDYEQVISKYGSSGKAASAYLKQGMCFIKAGKKDAAKSACRNSSRNSPSRLKRPALRSS